MITVSSAQRQAIGNQKLKDLITRNEIKLVRSLALKKYRDAEGLFVAEGPKVVSELLPLFACESLYATESFMRELENVSLLPSAKSEIRRKTVVTQEELERISMLKTPRSALAVFKKPARVASICDVAEWCKNGICLALDGVQDPGNLGTLLRVADWFGMEHVLASFDTADVFGPKVVQSTMGAIGRVRVDYVPLAEMLRELARSTPVYGTVLDGDDLYTVSLAPRGVIVMGNEGNGISSPIQRMLTHRLFIPNFPPGRATSESLNVGVAAAVVCAEFRRRAAYGEEQLTNNRNSQ